MLQKSFQVSDFQIFLKPISYIYVFSSIRPLDSCHSLEILNKYSNGAISRLQKAEEKVVGQVFASSLHIRISQNFRIAIQLDTS